MDKKLFFCPVCARVEAVDLSVDTTGKVCPYCGTVMLEKMTMNWDAVPPASRNEQRIKWIQEANLAQTFNADLYNKRSADPIYSIDDASGPVAPQGYGAPAYGAPAYGAPGYGQQIKSGASNFSGKVNAFVNKGGKGMFWIKVLKILAWISIIAYPLIGFFTGIAANNFWATLLGLIGGAIVGIIMGAFMMTFIHMAENVYTLADNSSKIVEEMQKK